MSWVSSRRSSLRVREGLILVGEPTTPNALSRMYRHKLDSKLHAEGKQRYAKALKTYTEQIEEFKGPNSKPKDWLSRAYFVEAPWPDRMRVAVDGLDIPDYAAVISSVLRTRDEYVFPNVRAQAAMPRPDADGEVGTWNEGSQKWRAERGKGASATRSSYSMLVQFATKKGAPFRPPFSGIPWEPAHAKQ